MKVKIILTLFTFTLVLALGYTAHAENLHDYYEDVTEDDLKNSMILSPESSMAFINGQKVSAVRPIVKDGRTLVPLRFISEGFGAKVDFNTKNQSITIKYANKTIFLKIGKNNISINGKSSEMDVAASIYNNSTYIPLRYIGEAFNKKVVYLKNAEIQPHSLIIIRDVNATAIENLNLIRVYELLNQGKSIVYSDRFMVVIKENGQLLLSDDFYNFKPFIYQELIEDENSVRLGDIWFNTDMGHFYLNYAYATTQEFILYRVDGEAITRVAIEKAPIKAVKTYLNDIYYLTRYERGILDAHETSNLKFATFNNGQWFSDYLGKPGFYYGFDTLGKVYDWQINDNGISTFGYQRSGDLSSDERKKTFGLYRIELKGHHHELVTP
ncbi:copper amine oxidase N-terminal domain-containing protein [Paenibacillus sp. MSJ-34]|uniref:copper amine oxidase N-terminal domain-containing protein n=1 Tax=Paenibacillus sp. MSJ-34 TaxID=2841529 RepID=UPI001C120E75|nr:copper amine oxidase N-terminal domain-containing protein [Paenibacillus sp. MSJ-34]MBU5442750.1 copper amine oxidase N-terminal domain-containing protein [Paenibacillus sp. MSJ-34]